MSRNPPAGAEQRLPGKRRCHTLHYGNDAMTAMLEMRGVSKSFAGVQALHDVNFAVEVGQIHALVGENGAGKSTLMKVLSGVYPYGTYEGTITLRRRGAAFPRRERFGGAVRLLARTALGAGIDDRECERRSDQERGRVKHARAGKQLRN